MHPRVKYVDELEAMPAVDLSRVRGVDGVAWAVPLYKGNAVIRSDRGAAPAGDPDGPRRRLAGRPAAEDPDGLAGRPEAAERVDDRSRGLRVHLARRAAARGSHRRDQRPPGRDRRDREGLAALRDLPRRLHALQRSAALHAAAAQQALLRAREGGGGRRSRRPREADPRSARACRRSPGRSSPGARCATTSSGPASPSISGSR